MAFQTQLPGGILRVANPQLPEAQAPLVAVSTTLARHLAHRRAYNYDRPANRLSCNGVVFTGLVAGAQTNIPTRRPILSSRIPIVKVGFSQGEQF